MARNRLGYRRTSSCFEEESYLSGKRCKSVLVEGVNERGNIVATLLGMTPSDWVTGIG